MDSSTPTLPQTQIPNDLAQRFERLMLVHAASDYKAMLEQAADQHWSHHRLLDELTGAELQHRSQKGLERRLDRSRLGRHSLMGDFDWNWPKRIDRPTIERALSGEFVAAGRNLILLGSNGVGKTMLAKNIARAAIFAGFSALFLTAAELLDSLAVDSSELRRKRVDTLLAPHLLVLDELGYLAYDDRAADLLFLVINARYLKRRSVLITTNLAFKDWSSVFPNATCILTLVDRLTHHADVVLIEAASHRMRESRLEAEARSHP